MSGSESQPRKVKLMCLYSKEHMMLCDAINRWPSDKVKKFVSDWPCHFLHLRYFYLAYRISWFDLTPLRKDGLSKWWSPNLLINQSVNLTCMPSGLWPSGFISIRIRQITHAHITAAAYTPRGHTLLTHIGNLCCN